ncbi:hypothetical protein FKM82_007402 [Ascaphus truei]
MKEVMVAQLDERILCNVSSLVAGSTPSDLNVTLSRGSLVLNRSRGASVEYNLRVAPEHHKMELLCEAELRVREQSFSQRTSAVLQVQYGPTDVGVTSDRRSFAIGDNITVRCSGDSNPPAEYAWNFPADGSAELASDGRSLVVRSATERDIGTYECIVGNSLGRNRSHIVILLSKGPGGGPPAWAVALIVAAGVASGVVLVALSFRFLRR